MTFKNQTFPSTDHPETTIILDFNAFEKCTFIKCQLVFHATGPVGMNGCTFDNCTWAFNGPAADTVKFMAALYSQGGGGRDLIESTLNNIRAGKLPNLGQFDPTKKFH